MPAGLTTLRGHRYRSQTVWSASTFLYEYAETWRVIWTDGRPLPRVADGRVTVGNEIREPRYYGYSVGRWVNDNTLVVDTVGTMGAVLRAIAYTSSKNSIA